MAERAEQALAQLVSELASIARPPAHLDRDTLGRLNNAFGRVRDEAPEAYGSQRSIASFHFETDYFADDDAGVRPELYERWGRDR